MKKNLQFLFIVISLYTLAGCNNANKTDSKATADTLNNMKDSAFASNKAITRDLQMTVSKDDAKFAVTAADAGMAEVVLSQLAIKKSVTPIVKDFAVMMIKDHSAANQKLIAMAKSKGISLPTALSDYYRESETKLTNASGDKFDKLYIKNMLEDHKRDVEDFHIASTSVKDPDLKNFVITTLPVLKMHLSAVEDISKK